MLNFLKLITKKMRVIAIILIIFSFNLKAQEDIKHIRKGNNLYKNEKYNDSEMEYRKALEKNTNSYKATFNLGDALYKQGKYEEAANQYQSLINNDLDKETLSSIYHNLGNSYVQSDKIKEGIEAYKQALRLNSKDMDTKYNLSHAMRLLQQQQQQQQENKDDKNQDKKDQEQKQDKQEQNKDNQDKKDKKEQEQQQQQEQKMSKEQAEQMLKSMENDEKELQEKLKQIQKGQKSKLEKDW